MKDCDGNELAVGDVVEVVNVDRIGYRHGWAWVFPSDLPNMLSIESVARDLRGRSYAWAGLYHGSELRLVRRKEMR